jgi:hypothetical protein
VEAIAGVRPNDPDLDAQFRQAADYVRQATAVDAARFQRALGGSFLKAAWRESTKLRTPFLGLGMLVGDLRIPGEGDGIQFVRIGSRTVLLSNLVMSEAATKGTVVFGGCFAEYLDSRSGEVIPVLQNAFLIDP